MDSTPPAPDSFRKLIHDLNQVVFLLKGHCELGLAENPDPANALKHLRDLQLCLKEMDTLMERLKEKQLELAPEE